MSLEDFGRFALVALVAFLLFGGQIKAFFADIFSTLLIFGLIVLIGLGVYWYFSEQ